MRDVIGEMRWGMMGRGYAGRYWKDEGIVWGMRDIIGRMRWDMRDGDMRDGPPPRNRPGRAAVFGPAPPIHEERETGTANDLQAEKRMLILYLTC